MQTYLAIISELKIKPYRKRYNLTPTNYEILEKKKNNIIIINDKLIATYHDQMTGHLFP